MYHNAIRYDARQRKFTVAFQSRMIGDAVYESLWYDLTPTENRGLLLMIVRSQKHLTLTVGKIMDLSLMQFSGVRISWIMKAAEKKVVFAHVIVYNILTT